MFFGSKIFYRPSAGTVLSHAVLGAVAGIAGAYVMDQVTTFLYQREGSKAREREDQARGGKTSFGVAADKLATYVDRQPLTRQERESWASALHWGTGASVGAIYGTWYALNPNSGIVRGLLFGAGTFLVLDELANTAMGLPPRKFPWQAHARGLAGHLAFGVAADATLRLIERPALSAVGLRNHVAS